MEGLSQDTTHMRTITCKITDQANNRAWLHHKHQSGEGLVLPCHKHASSMASPTRELKW